MSEGLSIRNRNKHHPINSESERTGLSSHSAPYSFRYFRRSSIIGPRSFTPRMMLRGTPVMRRVASLSKCQGLHLKGPSAATYDLMNLGNNPIIMPPDTRSMVYWRLRSIQSGSRPREIELRCKRKRVSAGSVHNGRPTNTLLLVLQTIFWMVLSAGTLFHSEYF